MGTTAEKLAYLKESKEQIKNVLETPYNVMRDYPALIKKYIDNQPTQVVADGVCKNALDVPLVSMGVDGNSEQKQYSGKNKFYYKQGSSSNNGITYTEQEDKSSMLLNGTSTSNSLKWIILDINKIYLSKGTYYLACCGTTDSNVYVGLGGKNSNNELLFSITNKGTDVKFTITEDAYLHSYIDVLNDVTVNNKLVKIMIVKDGEDTNTYEPYVGGQPSPNPEYPQEITNVGENGIKIKQSGKNLYNQENFLNANNWIKNTDSYYTGYANDLHIYINNNKNYIVSNFKENTQYSISLKGYSDSIGGNFRFVFKYTDGTSSTNYILNTITESDYRVISQQGKTISYITTNYSSSRTLYIKDFMLKEVNIGNEYYEPYHEPIITPINLQGNILSKVGGIKDILRVNRNGEVEIKKNIGKVILDGSEDENWKSLGKTFYADSINDYSEETFVPISNYFTGVSSKDGASSMTVDKTIAFANFRNPSRLYIKYDKMETMDAFKTWLSQHPTEVYYQLATPQIITLPSISPIELWQGTNIFKLITNLDTTFEAEYVVNKDYLETQNLLNIVEGESI